MPTNGINSVQGCLVMHSSDASSLTAPQLIHIIHVTLQCVTAKHSKVARGRIRFFGDKWTSDSDSEGLKASKNTLF